MLQIWWADVTALDDDTLYRKVYAEASACRRAKADRCVRRADKNLSLGVSALLDAGLRDHGLREATMVYGTGADGKPYFENAPDIHFNLSHSGEKAMVCLSDRVVGCDIEKLGEADLPLARRFFTHGEYARLTEISEPDARNEAFYRLWTLKESYLKQCGRGLRLSLSAFEITQEGGKPAVLRDGKKELLHFAEWEPFPGYRAALCVAEPSPEEETVCRYFDWKSVRQG